MIFEVFEEMDLFLGFSDKVNLKFVFEIVIFNENVDEELFLSSWLVMLNFCFNDSVDDNFGLVNVVVCKEKVIVFEEKRKVEEKYLEGVGLFKKKVEKWRKSDE